MESNSRHSILYGNIEIPTSHVNLYALDETVLLYEPTPDEIVNGENRNIFNNVPISDQEESIVEDFMKFIANDYALKNGSNKEEDLDWLYSMEPELLRFLYSSKFDFKKTLEHLLMNYKFRKSNMLPATLMDIEEELNQGCLYWFGRDKRCRPTLVADVFKLQHLSMEKLVKVVVFCFEFFLRYLHVGGKCENYNVLIDCDNKGFVQLPVQMIIQLTEIMNSKYRGRLNSIFLINSPNLINMIMKSLKGVLPDRILKKIIVLRENSSETLLSLYNPNQLQKRFGGSLPDLTKDYYPFQFFPDPINTGINNFDKSSKYDLFKIPPMTLYGSSLILKNGLSGHLLDSSDKNSGNYLLKNFKYFIFSKDTAGHLISKVPELKDEILPNTIQSREDLTNFVNNLNYK
ncbi:phosphoinositide binding protein (SEC14 homologue), putative [Theileria annulata]|uniref:Phosphoinositide binding protein (SEC14 homologue), putative n=1 Tax=Theileria annulata TaxID=5874 RepID=Q4U8F7_THEAN|nr:phosphoinositide binding protein (SEC14 homologue), putative [Theileria annulata]CAI76896.1 phosphoinositide binding protein (SEC14 homologue), putative [Theileria annulata]|eukprot:XP_953521.1 phosphoinositide binding protein (SEC14 homologue), putative [Theileria annulata]